MTDPSLDPTGVGHRARARRARCRPTTELTLLVWRFPEPLLAVSSAPLGGGHRAARLGDQRPGAPRLRTSRSRGAPGRAGRGARARGPGGGDAHRGRRPHACARRRTGALRVDVSVGVTASDVGGCSRRPRRRGPQPATGHDQHRRHRPRAAVARGHGQRGDDASPRPRPRRLWDAGVAATGTASDAVCLVCPDEGLAHPFGGPRSPWGARLARAVHRAVVAGCRTGAGRRDHARPRRGPLGQVRRGRALIATAWRRRSPTSPPSRWATTPTWPRAWRATGPDVRRLGARCNAGAELPRCCGPLVGSGPRRLPRALGGRRPGHGRRRRRAVLGPGRARRGHGGGLRGGRALGASLHRAGTSVPRRVGHAQPGGGGSGRRGPPRRGRAHAPPRPDRGGR